MAGNLVRRAAHEATPHLGMAATAEHQQVHVFAFRCLYGELRGMPHANRRLDIADAVFFRFAPHLTLAFGQRLGLATHHVVNLINGASKSRYAFHNREDDQAGALLFRQVNRRGERARSLPGNPSYGIRMRENRLMVVLLAPATLRAASPGTLNT